MMNTAFEKKLRKRYDGFSLGLHNCYGEIYVSATVPYPEYYRNPDIVDAIFQKLNGVYGDEKTAAQTAALCQDAFAAGMWVSYCAEYDRADENALKQKTGEMCSFLYERAAQKDSWSVISFLIGIPSPMEEQDQAALVDFMQFAVGQNKKLSDRELFEVMFHIGAVVYASKG